MPVNQIYQTAEKAISASQCVSHQSSCLHEIQNLTSSMAQTSTPSCVHMGVVKSFIEVIAQPLSHTKFLLVLIRGPCPVTTEGDRGGRGRGRGLGVCQDRHFRPQRRPC